MSSWLKEALPAPVRETLRVWRADLRDRREWEAWRRAPRLPPPHVVKVRRVLELARRFATGVLIESGTFEGEMARKCRHGFRRIVTIELDANLAQRAGRRLARYPNIEVLHGDSATVLPRVLAAVNEPALFWLDGHYSGTGTARGASDTPLVQELQAIARHGVHGDVVLVDDARLLGTGDYPGLEELRRLVAAFQPGGEVRVADDIVCCLPAGEPRAPRPDRN
jgi:hypothetical protein